jgi:hypothetical protein
MRTTIRIDASLLQEAKHLAVRTGRSLTAVIEDALRASLARQQQAADRQPVELATFRGQGLRPGVDLDDSASLLDLMEAADDGSG